MATKADSSRLNTFYILYVLANYSDEEHPLSVSDISKRVDEEFGYLSATGPLISSDTVKRTLEELTEKIFVSGIDDEMISHRFGYFIYCVMKQGKLFVPYRTAEGKQAPKKYYYYELYNALDSFHLSLLCNYKLKQHLYIRQGSVSQSTQISSPLSK